MGKSRWSETDWLADKVALITGASAGIGKQLALTLSGFGCKVVLTARRAELLDELVAEIEGRGGSAIAVSADVRVMRDAERVLEKAVARFGRIDWLVNNAGLYPSTTIREMTEDEWDTVLDTNLKGAFNFSKVVCQHFVEHGIAGRIVNIASTSAILARPGCTHYGSSKAGLVMFTKVLSLEMAPYGVLVNAVCPGVIETETVKHMTTGSPEAERELKTKLARIPLKRLGTAEEVVDTILFLLSPMASYMVGSAIVVDGGYSLGIPSY